MDRAACPVDWFVRQRGSEKPRLTLSGLLAFQRRRPGAGVQDLLGGGDATHQTDAQVAECPSKSRCFRHLIRIGGGRPGLALDDLGGAGGAARADLHGGPAQRPFTELQELGGDFLGLPLGPQQDQTARHGQVRIA